MSANAGILTSRKESAKGELMIEIRTHGIHVRGVSG